jgi:MoxR-like ATPase
MASRHQVDLSARFRATESSGEPYFAGKELEDAVNLAIALGRPLLVQGDPGAGKTRLAYAVADALGLPLEGAYVKSTSRANDLLYAYDAVRRLYDAQIPAVPQGLSDDYVQLGPLGRAIKRAAESGERSVVLIDEIDKADIDFPNDLLHELDQLRFDIPEVPGLHYAVPGDKPALRPVVIVTNNEEKALPAAFLRRCVFHYIEFPADSRQLDEILALHDIDDPELRAHAIGVLRRLREMDLAKKPGLAELLDWVAYLKATGTAPGGEDGIPFLGALVKQHTDDLRVREQTGGR